MSLLISKISLSELSDRRRHSIAEERKGDPAGSEAPLPDDTFDLRRRTVKKAEVPGSSIVKLRW